VVWVGTQQGAWNPEAWALSAAAVLAAASPLRSIALPITCLGQAAGPLIRTRGLNLLAPPALLTGVSVLVGVEFLAHLQAEGLHPL
jgi:hypothetical protein